MQGGINIQVSCLGKLSCVPFPVAVINKPLLYRRVKGL